MFDSFHVILDNVDVKHVIKGQTINHLLLYKIIKDPKIVVEISSETKKNVIKTRQFIEKCVKEKKVIYGVTTGFGAFKNVSIPTKDVKNLQQNLIFSHAVGVGTPFDEETVRGIIFLIANYLSKGHSGIRLKVIEALIGMLNKGIYPIIPEQGSVGSSGDLAPSSHLALVLIGQGKARYKDKLLPGAQAMKLAGIDPLTLEAKEGLALINNTTTMTSNAVIALSEAEKLSNFADIAGSLSAEAIRATPFAFDEDIHKVKPHKGQILVAKRLRNLINGSTMIDKSKVQNQYSIRCMPQIHGAIRDALSYVEKVVDIEINSVTDNPLIFLDKDGGKIISGGNFHGEPIAIAMDTLGIAVSELSNVSDRRIASLLDPATNNGLPAFLANKGGLYSGLMILQYTTASLVSENKILAHPASVDSIPTSANVEDLVSMGTIAARKARKIVKNVRYVLAIELLVSCQAIDFRLKEGFKLGKETEKIYRQIRKIVPFFERDQIYYPYISTLLNFMDELYD